MLEVLTGNPFLASCLFSSLLLAGWKISGRDRTMPLAASLFPPVWAAVSNMLLGLSTRFLPVTLDRYLYAADGSFGYQAAFAGARLLIANPWLWAVCEFCYYHLPLAMTATYLAARRRSPDEAGRLIRFGILLAVTGYAIYALCPAVGPAAILKGDFPYRAPALPLAPVELREGARNCMPSLHMAWTLLILAGARYFPRRARPVIWAFAAFTLVYTLSAGWHYLVDLIVAAPFYVAVETAMAGRWRSWAFVGNAGAVVLWLLSIRFGGAVLLLSPVIPHALAAVTLLIVAHGCRRAGAAGRAAAATA